MVEERQFLLFHPVGALAAGEDGGVERQMAQQIKRVRVRLARLGGDLGEINPALGQLADVFRALAGIGRFSSPLHLQYA
jgi:hypothetical protein